MNNRHVLPANPNSPPKMDTPPPVTGTLQVSQSVLRFDRTDPGDESFLIVKVATTRPGVAVMVSAEPAGSFQVAVGVERLLFGPELTLTPPPGGTYIHLRYAPKRAGRHRENLTLQTVDETVTVWLTGRTGGIPGFGASQRGGRVRSVRHVALPAAPEPRRPIGLGVKLTLLAGVLAGLVGAGYAYRCQIWPATCSPFGATPAPVVRQVPDRPAPSTPSVSKTTRQRVNTPPVEARPADERPAPASETRPASPQVETVTKTERTRQPVPTTVETRPTRRPEETAAETRPNADPKPVTRPAAQTERTTTADQTKPTPAQRTQVSPAKPAQKPTTTPRAAGESDLERILNRPDSTF